MSNALSGVVACNTHHPVIACPPHVDKVDMMTNINSTLQMPSSSSSNNFKCGKCLYVL